MNRRILCLFTPAHRARVFRPEAWERIRALGEVIEASGEAADRLLPECDAVLTGWGTQYAFTKARIDSASRLRVIAHTAGSVKHLFPEAEARDRLRERNIPIFSGNEGIAMNVAEATVGYLILALRRWPELVTQYPRDHKTAITPADNPPRNGQYLTGATIGLVAMSTVARLLLPHLRLFNCKVLVYDPYLPDATAERLGVERVTLDELFRRSDAVSIHAPSLPETRGMIGAKQLALLRDGAALINTSRGTVLDEAALAAECRNGRIVAALDVTDPEPPLEDSPLWKQPNIYLTPHIAGSGHEGYFHIGEMAAQAVRSAFAGQPVIGAVPLERWETIA